MQTKLFLATERQGLVPGTINSLVATNSEERKANFHNMHWSGRVLGDEDGATVGFSSGWIAMFCYPSENIPLETSLDRVKLDASQGNVVLAKQWMVVTKAAYEGDGRVFDWDIPLGKISRTCPKEGRIVCQVHNDTGSVKDILVTQTFSYNITQA